MSHIDLRELSKRESERVEWKENVADVSDLARTACAFSNDFSNMGGGYIVCGAKEEKDPHGFQSVKLVGLESSRLKEIEGKLLSICRSHIDPPIVPVTEEIETADPSRRILVFVVPATAQAHSYKAQGEGSPTYYIRVGRDTIQARNGLYRELLVRKGALETWERRLASTSASEDLDLLVLRDSLQRMGLWDSSRSIDDILSDVHQISVFSPPLLGRESLTNILRPRNFAMLLFAHNPMKAAPGAYVVVSFYPGTDRSEPIAQRFELTGSIIRQAEKALELLEPETGTMFDKESKRPNLVKYPRRALQESIVNAIVHRDYESTQPVRITVFSNRIEILSPGSLPSAVPENRFVMGTASPFWRNQALAFFFNKLQLAQAEGQGIPTILKTMRHEGNPDPRFEIESEQVITILPAHPRHEMMRRVAEGEIAPKPVSTKGKHRKGRE